MVHVKSRKLGRPTLHGVQLVRGIAAVMVVLFHIGRMLLYKTGADITRFTCAGAAGVDLFFVVSGFIMVYTTTDRDFSLSAFLYRRVIRVVPLYWLMTLLVAGLALSAPAGLFAYHLDRINFAAAFVFFPTYDAKGEIFPPLTQGWTLVYEMFFYFALAAASSALYRYRILILIGLFCFLIFIGLVSRSHNAALITYTDPILFEFLLGSVAAKLLLGNRLHLGANTAVALIVIGTVALLAGSVFADAPRLRVLFWGIPALLVVVGTVAAEGFLDFGAWRILQAIGDSSYSLYLSHALVLSGAGLILRIEPARIWGGVPLVPFFCALSVAVGWLCWRYIERPMTLSLIRSASFALSRAEI